jgi:hypothetical protein
MIYTGTNKRINKSRGRDRGVNSCSGRRDSIVVERPYETCKSMWQKNGIVMAGSLVIWIKRLNLKRRPNALDSGNSFLKSARNLASLDLSYSFSTIVAES